MLFRSNKKYSRYLGQGNAELFVQFLTRIYFDIPNCSIAQFSKLKIINGPHFADFRQFFKAKSKKAFICPANSFDNVKGQFPIGFIIWNTSEKEQIDQITTDVYGKDGKNLQTKILYSYDKDKYINDWIKPHRADPKKNQLIGKFPFKGNDFQNQNIIQIVHHKMNYNTEAGQFLINQKNVFMACIYFAVRKCISATWLNDRDQFLFPNDGWKTDIIFQNDCMAYALFSNNIQSKYGSNHWIPFSEQEINAREKFESDFMAKYLAGKINIETTDDLFSKVEKGEHKSMVFGNEAQKVFSTGKELWKYYHHGIKNIPALSDKLANVNASLYDIREYFQGRNENGKMKNKSEDEKYNQLIADLRDSLKALAQKIEPKVYEYGFLKM